MIEKMGEEDRQQQIPQIAVRINGVLPRMQALGDERQSERAAEVKSMGKFANTSCSIISRYNEDAVDVTFHILVDAGQGVLESMKNGFAEAGLAKTHIPNIILITNAREVHVEDLSAIVSEASSLSLKLKVMCTKECMDQLVRKYPSLLANNQVLSFELVQQGEEHIVDGGVGRGEAYSITPIAAENGGAESPTEPGAVIYLIKIGNVKIITAWDFISIPGENTTNPQLLWNPDLLVIGTETYNDHPSTGSISVSDAYRLIMKWNATNSFLVNYGGMKDFDDAKNQWFRGPIKAMTTGELQKTIDSYLRVAGQEGKIKITVAKEDMVWRPPEIEDDIREDKEGHEEIGNTIEITSMQKYIIHIRRGEEEKTLNLDIEDNVNRLSLEFVNPHATGNGEALEASPKKSMFLKGPELKMEVVPASRELAILKVSITQGRKTILKDDIQITPHDATRLIRYFDQNFGASI